MNDIHRTLMNSLRFCGHIIFERKNRGFLKLLFISFLSLLSLQFTETKFGSKMHITEGKGSGDLRPHQNELHHLAQMAGLNMSPRIFRIIIEMLNIGVDPRTIYSLFRSAVKHRRSV